MKNRAPWLTYDFGTDNDNDNVGEVEPARAHGSGRMRMGNKTVASKKGRSIEKLAMRCEGER